MSGFSQPPTSIPGDLAVTGDIDITGTYYVNGVPITQEQDSFVDKEGVAGTKDGVNTAFTLANIPITVSVHLYLNGILQTVIDDYTISGNLITMIVAPQSDDKLIASYRK